MKRCCVNNCHNNWLLGFWHKGNGREKSFLRATNPFSCRGFFCSVFFVGVFSDTK